MDFFVSRLLSLIYGEKGQTLVEYGLILLLIAIIVIIMLRGFGHTVTSTYSTVNSAMP